MPTIRDMIKYYIEEVVQLRKLRALIKEQWEDCNESWETFDFQLKMVDQELLMLNHEVMAFLRIIHNH